MTLVQIPKLTTTLEDFLKNLESIEPLFDALSSVVFFIKNTEARYVFVNQTLVNRCGLKDKTAILGKTSSEVFPHSLGKIYTSQDLQVIRRGKKLTEQLELHLYAKNQSGWCLTYKEPLFDADGNLVGIAGISNDLNVPENTHPAFYKMVQVEEYIKKNYAETITVAIPTIVLFVVSLSCIQACHLLCIGPLSKIFR